MIREAFQAFASTSTEPQVLLDVEGEILVANDAFADLLPQRDKPVEGSRLGDWVTDETSRLEEYLKQLRRSGGTLPGAVDLIGSDGELKHCRVEGGRVQEPGAGADAPPCLLLRLMPRETSPSRFASLTRQVKDLQVEVGRRRRAEQLLERQKGLLEGIVGNVPLPEVLASITGFVEEHSDDALCSILLLSTDKKRLLFGAAPSLPREYNEAIDGLEIGPKVGSCGTAAHLGETVVVSDIATDPLWAEFKGLAAEHGLAACWSQPVKGPDGNVLATLAMYYRQPSRPSADDLYLTSIGVDLAAIAILGHRARQALRDRAEELAEADRRKDRFLAMLSHELRNPLAPIVNTLEVLRDRAGLDVETAEHVARLERQTTHMSRLVDDLLDISRISHGAIELKIERVDLRFALAQAVDSIRELILSKKQTLSTQDSGEAIWVEGDLDRLRQIFANLLTNASKYTDPGGIIQVDLAVRGGTVIATVSDNGHGLSEAVRERLFEPFAQGGRDTVDSRAGLGLGLTLVRQLVECHGGTIEAESEGLGKGSTFTVRLPAVESGDEAMDPPERLRSVMDALPLDIMVVEDNTDSADALSVLLELWGHEARVAYEGESAIRSLLDQPADVVLLDIDLPGQDGYSVLRALRREGFSTEGRLMIALTGFGRLQDMEKSAAAGFHHHLIKPADPTTLRRLLADFSRQRTERQTV